MSKKTNTAEKKGSAFTSKLFNDYCDEENIQHLQIATGVPRGNGQVERIHRTLIPVLTKLSLDDSTKWYKYVERLQRILNSTISRSTKWTPFELLVGIKMRNKEDILIKDLLLEEMAKEILEQREFLRNDAKRTSKPCSLKIERRITEEERKLRCSKKNGGDDITNETLGNTVPLFKKSNLHVPDIKSSLKGTHFTSVEEVQAKTESPEMPPKDLNNGSIVCRGV
ncbi:pro-Pol polyprotein [Trichonephila clavipes]|nr:pro-Pol polyprotein [Trichonephila clavipes]